MNEKKYKYIYETEFSGLCPTFRHDVVNNYEATFKTNKMIMVEKIKEVLLSYKNKKLFQESLTEELAHSDWFYGEVTLIGEHQGVTIISTISSTSWV